MITPLKTTYAPSDDYLQSIPELIEPSNSYEAFLIQRNALMRQSSNNSTGGIGRDLGPHDLVYLTKSRSRSTSSTKSGSSSDSKQVYILHDINLLSFE